MFFPLFLEGGVDILLLLKYIHILHKNRFKMFFFISICYRYSDGTVKLRNPHIELMDQDILYHLALGSGSHDLVEMFGDVKVCLCAICKSDFITWKLHIFRVHLLELLSDCRLADDILLVNGCENCTQK